MSLFTFGKAVARGLTKAILQNGAVRFTPFAPQGSSQACILQSNCTVKHIWLNFTRAYYPKNIVSDFRRKACQSFIGRNAPKFPMLAFAGFCLSGDQEAEKKASITNLVQYCSSNLNDFWKEEGSTEAFPRQFSGYNIGERLGKPSSNAAVYSADYNGSEVALKIMFNYSVPSNETAISEAFEREYTVFEKLGTMLSGRVDVAEQQGSNETVAVMEHPNIIKPYGKFVDRTPLLHDSIETYPVAVPRSLYCDGYGRNKTLCLVMPKYTCALREYLNVNTLTHQQCISIFHQLLDGVAHLEQHRISHRDLKSDNILINTHEDGSVQVVITDFGCCLVGQDMLLPYNTRYTDRGGNFSLLAPEIANAVPCEGLYLDYSKTDAWTCGSIAYEIFNQDNPFYTRLRNIDYNDGDIEEIPLQSGFQLVDSVVNKLLQKEPENRISACDATAVISLLLNAPPEWLRFPLAVSEVEVETWLLASSITIIRKCKLYDDPRFLPPDILSNLVFLSRVSPSYIMEILELISEMQNN